MFYGCSLLTSLDLSNFETSQVTEMYNMFEGCFDLEYINLKNFNESKLTSYSNMFKGVPDNVIICINENNTNNTIFPQIKEKKCYTIDCSNNWQKNQIKRINKTNICTDINNISIQYNYEYQGLYYESCINGNLINNSTINSCNNCDKEKCLSCPSEAFNKNLCTKCNNNYYPKENDTSNYKEYFDCYKNIKGYYLDKNDSLFKKCYKSCDTCIIKGNNLTS